MQSPLFTVCRITLQHFMPSTVHTEATKLANQNTHILKEWGVTKCDH